MGLAVIDGLLSKLVKSEGVLNECNNVFVYAFADELLTQLYKLCNVSEAILVVNLSIHCGHKTERTAVLNESLNISSNDLDLDEDG